jgi:hypothetical protein
MGLSARSGPVLVLLAGMRETLPAFATFGFPGHAVTGRDFTTTIARATQQASDQAHDWWLIHALRPIVPLCRELSEMAYLWREPHRIDGSKLRPRSATFRIRRLTMQSHAPYRICAQALDARCARHRPLRGRTLSMIVDFQHHFTPHELMPKDLGRRKIVSYDEHGAPSFICIGCCSISTSTSA